MGVTWGYRAFWRRSWVVSEGLSGLHSRLISGSFRDVPGMFQEVSRAL